MNIRKTIPGYFALAFGGLMAFASAPLHAASQVNIKVQNPGPAAAPGPDTAALMQKARQDSLARADKAKQDSLALTDAQRRLKEEQSKRSAMETQLLTTGLLVLDAVYFETGRTEISINSKPYLSMLARMLTKYPKLQIEIDGHTDNVGNDAYNQNLSQGRAAAVTSFLTTEAQELAGRLSAKGFGESSPKADNRTAEGRTLNRRTELQVLNKAALEEYREPGRRGYGPVTDRSCRGLRGGMRLPGATSPGNRCRMGAFPIPHPHAARA